MTAAKLQQKTHKVCKPLAKIEISLPTPTQSGVYKATIKAGDILKEHFTEILKNENTRGV